MSYFDDASLVMIPSGYKTSKVYSVKPTSGDGDLTFTRSNDTATRVGPDGLIEKVRTNVLLQSNTFSTTWTNLNSTETGGQTGYDGTTNAWLISATGGSAGIIQNISQSGMVTQSVYAKAGTSNWLMLRLTDGTNNNLTYVDLTNRVFGNTAPNFVRGIITDVGGGWSRVSVTINQASYNSVYFYIAKGNNDLSTTNETLFIQNAQLEAGDIATDYIATTTAAVSVGPVANVPRLDYLNSSCPRLLLEPQRTNKQKFSEQINTTNYSVSNQINVTANAGVSPDGYTNADKIIPTTTSAFHQVRSDLATVNGYDIISVFVKASGYNYVQLVSWADPTNYVNFDLTDGTVGTVSVATVYGIQSYGNGWYRIWANVQASGAGIVGIGVVTSKTAGWSQSFAGNGTDGVLMWGVQIEAATYPSSYIGPTLGAAVTRGADNTSLNPATLLGATTGSWYSEIDDITFEFSGTSVPTNYIGGDATNLLGYEARSGNNKLIHFVKEESNAVTTLYSFTPTGKHKACFVWSGTSLKLFVDGVKRYDAGSFVQPAAWDEFQYNFSGREAQQYLNQTLLFPTALSDADAIALTA